MESTTRFSPKYLLLQVWCGLLTVAVVVLAAFLVSMKPMLSEDRVTAAKPQNVGPTVNSLVAPLRSTGDSLSYIELMKSLDGRAWLESLPGCHRCVLSLHDDSIRCTKTSLYFIYAQVTFTRLPSRNQTRSVILKRNPTFGRGMRKLVEGTFPGETKGSVWVARIVHLTEGDSISLDVTDDFMKDTTFWGAYQLL